MSETKILLVEDEENLRNSLSFILQERGYHVDTAATGEEGLELARSGRPEMALIDIGLPGMDGFQLAAKLGGLRRETGMVIVFLTGSDDEDDIVRGLDGLADDYIVKPVRPRVLIARLAAILARRESGPDANTEVECGPIKIKPVCHEARLDGRVLELTPTEFKLLLLLARSPGRAFSRTEIISHVHGEDTHLTDRAVDFQVHGLRRKLEDRSSMLATVRGIGFKLTEG